MSVSVEDFVQRVAESGLMEAGEVAAFHDSLPVGQRPADGEGLAQRLVADAQLTSYQAGMLLQGDVQSLCLDDYLILDKIGEGGMGVVFRARHRRMEREVAIKTLADKLVDSPDAVQRFYKEIRVAGRLTHPNIVQAYDARESRGTHFLVMEYVRGRSLAQAIEQDGPLPVRQAVEYILQAAQGLEHAHRRGVIHRDIKPANLLVDNAGTVKILDMGLARLRSGLGDDVADSSLRLTRTGQVMGTVDFLPPEQALDTRSADHRADIYALGCTLYQLLTGRPPYAGDTVLKKLLAHREAEVPSIRAARADVPPSLDRVFRKMVAKRPEDRYASADEAARELKACLELIDAVSPAGKPPAGDEPRGGAATPLDNAVLANVVRPGAPSAESVGESPFRADAVLFRAAARMSPVPGSRIGQPARKVAAMPGVMGLRESVFRPPLRNRLILGAGLATLTLSFFSFAGGLLGIGIWLVARRDLAAIENGALDERGTTATRAGLLCGAAAALVWMTSLLFALLRALVGLFG